MKALAQWFAIPVTAFLLATGVQAQVKVDNAWVRATVPQQSGTGAFMQLTAEKDSKLVQAASPIAKHVEIHEMAMDNHVMKMRQIGSLPLPAGKTVELRPGGYHIMFLELHGQVKEGDEVPVTLTFESADGQRSSLDLNVKARPLATGAHGAVHGHAAQSSAGHGASHGMKH
jgi:Uncharacterized protein conserved in bacteria